MGGSHSKIGRRSGRLRGRQRGAGRATRDQFPAAVVILTSFVLYAAILTWRLLSDSDGSGFALFYSLPIALLALRFGLRGGLVAALIAEGLFVLSALTVADYSGALPYVSRATAFFVLGGLVGYLSDRIAANEARFSLALRYSEIFVFTMDRDLRFTWVYHGWSGPTPVDMIGKTDRELLPPEYAGPIMALKRRVLESGDPETAELPAQDHEGRQRWFRLAIEPTRDATGKTTGLMGTALDITELRETHRELELSEERFRTAVDNMIEPFALYSAIRDDHGEIVDFRCEYINQPGAGSVGMQIEDMRGKSISDLFPGRLESGLTGRYAAVVESGEPQMREEVDFINVFGQETLVRAFDIRVAKFGDGVEITWRDITERKRAENERDWAAAIVDASLDAIMGADVNGVIKSWSRGAELLYGWTAEEIIGKNFLDTLIPPESKGRRSALFSRIAAGKSVGPVRDTELQKSGRPIDVTFTATPITDAEGEIVGAARIVRKTQPSEGLDSPKADDDPTSPEVLA